MSAKNNRKGDYAVYQLTKDIEGDSDEWDVNEREESEARW
jgi:hypothetical protein